MDRYHRAFIANKNVEKAIFFYVNYNLVFLNFFNFNIGAEKSAEINKILCNFVVI